MEDELVFIFMSGDLVGDENGKIFLEIEMKSSHKNVIGEYVQEIKNSIPGIGAILIKTFNEENIYFKNE